MTDKFPNMNGIVERLNDLHKQATVERSHFYVGKTVKEAATEIERLRSELEKCKQGLILIRDSSSDSATGLKATAGAVLSIYAARGKE